MRTSPLLLMAFWSTALLAQPVLEYPNAIPAFGPYPVVARSYGVVPGIAQSGTAVLWDLSAVSYTEIGTTTDSVLDPAATPYAADYPGATHAVRLVDQFGYYRIESTGVDDLGYRLSPTGSSFVYSDPAHIVQFPSVVGESWSDATQSGSTITTLTVTLLAEGELRLADGTIPDAVLVRREYVGPSSTATSTTWFRRSDALRPLGNLLANGSVIVRAPVDLLTAVEESSKLLEVTVLPNPCTDLLSIWLTQAAGVDLQLCDGSGRAVLSQRSNSGLVYMDLSTLPKGLYVLRVVQGSASTVRKVVKE